MESNEQSFKDEWGKLNPQNKIVVEEYLTDIKNNKCMSYMITVARDGESPERSVIFYDTAIEAVGVYNSYFDWGFAKDFLTVKMYEPNGKINEKILKRPSGMESTFMRKNYIEISKIFLSFKDRIEYECYKEMLIKISKVFAVDNKRFDAKRFLEEAECLN